MIPSVLRRKSPHHQQGITVLQQTVKEKKNVLSAHYVCNLTLSYSFPFISPYTPIICIFNCPKVPLWHSTRSHLHMFHLKHNPQLTQPYPLLNMANLLSLVMVQVRTLPTGLFRMMFGAIYQAQYSLATIHFDY